MSSEKPNFLSQPIVKNVFMFRNGDPYYEARRVVINHKRISNFETLLREVTGGIQAPFGAVRNIYTPIGGHKVDCLESLKSGEQYVAAGREKFKRLDYQQIGLRRKRMMHTLPMQAKPVPQNRIIVSARFLKPIKEPCPIFVVANGDVLDPAARLLIHQKMLGQFDRILEMVTEKMGLKVLGGVRSLYTYEGHQVTDGNQLESGQLYVAVGRERFKKLPYSDLLFTKPRGARRVNGMKAHSLPPIYRFSKQNGNSKSVVRSSDSGDGDSKNSPPRRIGSNKEHLSSFVREISQARLISLRKKRSGQSMTFSISDNADLESKADDRITEDKTPQDQLAEETTADDGTKAGEGNSKKAGEEEEEAAPKNTTEEDISTGKEEKEENQETYYVKERGEEKEENDERNDEKDGDATAGSEEKEEEVEEEVKEEVTDESQEENGSIEKKEEVKEEVMEEVTDESKEENGSIEKKEEAEEEVMEEVTDESKEELTDEEQGSKEKEEELKKEAKGEVINESKEEVKKHEQGSRSSNSDKTQDSKDKEDGTHPSSEHEKDEQDKNTEEERVDKESGKGQKSSEDQVNDEGEGKKQKEMENSNDPGKPQSDNETRESDSRSSSSSSSNSNQEEDVSETKEGHIKEAGERERKIN